MLTNEGSSCEEEVFRACKPLGEVWVWQHPCELAMPERWHCSAMRLQQSRSAAVIVAPATVHAITGRAASSSARIETPALAAKFTPISLVPNICKRQRIEKGFKSSVSWPLLIASMDEFVCSLRLVTVNR